jgi:hypothetical protein
MRAVVPFLILAACSVEEDGNTGGDTPPVTPLTLFVDGETAGDVGDYPSIAVDSSGTVHIAYVDDATDALKVARIKSDAVEAPVTVSGAGEFVQDTAIVIDSAGSAGIIYHEAISVDLKYVRASGSSFGAPAIVDGAGHQSGTGLRVAKDPAGNVHALYFDYAAVSFKIATASNGTFGAGVAVPEIVGGASPMIAFSKSGALQVTQTLELDGQTFIERASGGSFGQGQVVDPQGRGAALVATDAPHIAYEDSTTGMLKYATRGASGFAPVAVDPGGVAPAIAASPDGVVHVAHFDLGAERVRFARIAGGMVVHRRVLEDIDAYPASALAVDAAGTAHVVYRVSLGQGRSALKYARIPAEQVHATPRIANEQGVAVIAPPLR